MGLKQRTFDFLITTITMLGILFAVFFTFDLKANSLDVEGVGEILFNKKDQRITYEIYDTIEATISRINKKPNEYETSMPKIEILHLLFSGQPTDDRGYLRKNCVGAFLVDMDGNRLQHISKKGKFITFCVYTEEEVNKYIKGIDLFKEDHKRKCKKPRYVGYYTDKVYNAKSVYSKLRDIHVYQFETSWMRNWQDFEGYRGFIIPRCDDGRNRLLYFSPKHVKKLKRLGVDLKKLKEVKIKEPKKYYLTPNHYLKKYKEIKKSNLNGRRK